MFEAYHNLITETIEFIQDLQNKLEGTETSGDLAENFDLPGFCVSLNAHSQAMILNISKLTLAISETSNISSSDFSKLLNSIQNDLSNLSAVFFTFPKDCGSTLRSTINKMIVKIATCMHDYYKCFLKRSTSQSNLKQDIMSATGVVWSACEEFGELPIDNKSAVLKIIETEEALVVDAFDEIHEVMTSEQESRQICDDIEMVWNNEQFEMVENGVAIVKTLKVLCNKLKAAITKNGKCTNGTQIAQLDDIVESFKKLSPAVDDFILSLYPPCNFNIIRSNVSILRTLMHGLLQQAKKSHYIPEEEMQWVNFLTHATTHNCNKIESMPAAANNSSPSSLIILKDLSLE